MGASYPINPQDPLRLTGSGYFASSDGVLHRGGKKGPDLYEFTQIWLLAGNSICGKESKGTTAAYDMVERMGIDLQVTETSDVHPGETRRLHVVRDGSQIFGIVHGSDKGLIELSLHLRSSSHREPWKLTAQELAECATHCGLVLAERVGLRKEEHFYDLEPLTPSDRYQLRLVTTSFHKGHAPSPVLAYDLAGARRVARACGPYGNEQFGLRHKLDELLE